MPGGRDKGAWKKIVVAAAIAATLVGLGVLAGFFIGRAATAGGKPGAPVSDDSTVAMEQLVHLPEPGSEEAQRLLEQPDTPDWVRDQYAYHQDSQLITSALSSAFLEQFDRQQQQLGAGAAANLSSVDLAPFIRVATDLLSYLRFTRSEVLLSLLRDFSSHGALAVEAADPDSLQREVGALLRLDSLNKFYAARWRSDAVGEKLQPSPQATAFLMQQGPVGRRRLQQRRLSGAAAAPRAARRAARRLHVAAGVIPAIPATEVAMQSAKLGSPGQHATARSRAAGSSTAAAGSMPTESPPQTLQDMLCSIASFSPSGLQGMRPVGAGANKNSSSSSKALACPAKPPGVRLFAFQGIAFKPVKIPVVFHCFRYPRGKTLMPPLWDPQAAANNILKTANKFYQGTGIQFSLLEIRHDPKKHPYLLMPSLEAWQHCSANQQEYENYFPCLSAKAVNATLKFLDGPNRHAINVFVSGSRDQASLCDMAASPPPECATLLAGYANPEGPWFAEPSETWTEDNTEENWVFVTFDMFNPDTRNNARFWDGGGCTLAHELGHYLGLRHTHAGAAPCDGDGLSKADAVPDTPANLQVDEYAASKNLLAALTGWCVDFRTGRRPPLAELAPFNSCSKKRGRADSGRIDNVFNLMSYTMDPCCMILTPNQIARLQWAIAAFRPKMMKAFAV